MKPYNPMQQPFRCCGQRTDVPGAFEPDERPSVFHDRFECKRCGRRWFVTFHLVPCTHEPTVPEYEVEVYPMPDAEPAPRYWDWERLSA